MRTFVALLLLCLANFIAAGEPTKAQLDAMFKEGERQRSGTIASTKYLIERTQDQLRYARAGKHPRTDVEFKAGHLYWESDIYVDFTSDIERAEAVARIERDIERLRDRLKEAEDKRLPPVPEIKDYLEVGKIGRLPYGATVRRRQNDTEAVVMVSIRRSETVAGDSFRKVQAILRGVNCSPASIVLGGLQLPDVYMVTGIDFMPDGKEEFVLEPVDVRRAVASQAVSMATPPEPAPKRPPALQPVRKPLPASRL